ncbi:hypothetical protein BDY24DRAFT_128087 [Mrakia frigida]|uniref:uncharacterized protein n=1 Tax=Mrakia frigida TaxID=29902 RepID=UPI003FCC17B7
MGRAAKVKKNQKAMSRWTRTKVLIIDEVSMVDGDLFDKLAKIATILRRDQAPFGGIQLIVTGDFFQVRPSSPPLFSSTPRLRLRLRRLRPDLPLSVCPLSNPHQLPPVAKGEPKFAFEARMWKESIHRTVNLTQVSSIPSFFFFVSLHPSLRADSSFSLSTIAGLPTEGSE